jgi:hypothetical protein
VRPGRLALLTATAAYAGTLVWAAVVLQERVPSHVDAAGRVDDWTSRPAMLAFWGAVGVVVLAGIPALARWATAGDGTWVNMPQRSKDHWFAPERRAEFRVRFQDDMEAFTALTGALLVAVLAVATWLGATGRDGVPWWVHPVLVGAYLVATVVWTVRLLRAYRPPDAV